MRYGKSQVRSRKSEGRSGFSLVEVLLAIFILGIGMIMVASVFPVGANWTRQTAEESVAQTVSMDAQAVVRRHYGDGGDLRRFLAPDFLLAPNTLNPANGNSILKNAVITPFALQALPGFITNGTSPGVPPSERAYQFGSNSPFPAADWTRCTYFWTAVARLSPMHQDPADPLGKTDGTNGVLLSSSYNYDVYILVFRKGAVENVFNNVPPATPAGYAEIPGLRDSAADWGGNPALMPSVGYVGWAAGTYNAASTPSVVNAVPPVGQYGIGGQSGTVFRQVLNPATYQSAIPRPAIISNPAVEPVIYAPAADGNSSSASPLIYIYQTTLSF